MYALKVFESFWSICAKQLTTLVYLWYANYTALSRSIPSNWILSLKGTAWFLIAIFIDSSFLFFHFLNIMFAVFLVEKVSPLSAAHASNLFITPCCALAASLWFLVVIYIARPSTKSDQSTQFSNSPRVSLIATRKSQSHLVLFLVEFSGLYLFCGVNLATLTFIHLKQILLNFIDHWPLIIFFLMFSNFLYFHLISCWRFSIRRPVF